MKGYYASELLYTSSICFSKLSLLYLFYMIVAGRRTQRRVVLAFGGFILAWSLSSLVVIAFQCQLPRPWEMMTLRCFNTVRVTVRTAINIAWKLIVLASVLDRLLHHRYVHRTLDDYALRQPCRILTHSRVAQSSSSGLFRASQPRRRCIAHPLSLALSHHATQRSRISPLAPCNSDASACVFEHLHCLYTIYGTLL
jgi:hypothetical protein